MAWLKNTYVCQNLRLSSYRSSHTYSLARIHLFQYHSNVYTKFSIDIKMTHLQKSIALKASLIPSVYSSPPMVYPYDTRGMFRSEYFPLPQARYAGYKPELKFNYRIKTQPLFSLPDGCFETAPSTNFPCWESGFGCQTPPCTRTYGSSACMYRAGMR